MTVIFTRNTSQQAGAAVGRTHRAGDHRTVARANAGGSRVRVLVALAALMASSAVLFVGASVLAAVLGRRVQMRAPG